VNDVAGKRVLVLGLGMSGRSAARFLAERGAHVVAADERPAAKLPELASLPSSIELRLGQALPPPNDFDLVVPSPGIPVSRWHEARARVAGDIELTGRHLQVPFAAITGTNGKSTTVALLEAMLNAAGLRARAAGNLGVPALSLVGEPLDVAVLEVSSFQLESTSTFRPKVAAVLNVSPDHLDWHGDLEQYVAAKRRLLAHQTADDFVVLNVDDPIVRSFEAGARARVVRVSTQCVPEARGSVRQAWIDGGVAVLREGDRVHRISLEGLRLAGRHNLENVLVALASVWCLGADVDAAATALARFEGLRHRCEIVARHDAVTWVNDSKATNVGAAVKALAGFANPVIWIAGGRGKGANFAALADVARTHARLVLLIGEDADRLAETLHAAVPCERVETLARAVERAREVAKPGDVVLLAPACASFDQFENFEDRGDAFVALVGQTVEGAPRS
jgi:UDP-N-acetylmuramoylalanine--D-glutamate ligase